MWLVDTLTAEWIESVSVVEFDLYEWNLLLLLPVTLFLHSSQPLCSVVWCYPSAYSVLYVVCVCLV